MKRDRQPRQVALAKVAHACLLTFLSLAAAPATAQERSMTSGYRLPPKAIADLVDAPPTPFVSLSPNREWLLLMELPNLPPLSELAQPELRLAGLRLNPRTNGPSRAPYIRKLTLKRLSDGREKPITGLPADPRIGSPSWSPDGEQIAFSLTRSAGIELWVADVQTAKARRLSTAHLNAAYGAPFDWLPDSQALVAKVVPADRGPQPKAPTVPTGPIIQENLGRVTPARTYQDLLENSHDEALFEHYLTSQAVRVTLDGKSAPLGPPGIIRRAEVAPGGRYVLVESIHRPFSYLVPVHRFPLRVEVRDMQGRVVRKVADLPLAEEVPITFDAVPKGPRAFGWRSDAPATLVWAEAQDEGDPAKKVEIRDRVFMLPAPFRGKPVPLVALGLRYGGIRWGRDDLALVSESWWQTRKERTWIVRPGTPGTAPRVLFDRSSEDRYNDPGTPIMRRASTGAWVLHTTGDGQHLFLLGSGASPEGDRPFLDRLHVPTAKTERLWQSAAPFYERPVELLDDEGRRIVTRREARSEPPNYFVRNLDADQLRPLTRFPHPTPQLANVQKELIRYERGDGVKLTATLYLPPGYSSTDGPLPLLMWAYPQEFKSADAAGQVTDSPHRFVRVSPGSPLLWLVHGFAVLDNPSMPIVGEGDREPNDTYIEQLVASAKAAVDEVVRRGVADRERIAIGGHSYGAFMTANLLAHSDLFRAGIARSGAYNRTLTPFGFQAEERTLWQAPETYAQMSPFMHAHKVIEPILLIHGEADNNPGTFPVQSERFYSALKGHGATTRLVMLPLESHGYQGRESVMHMLWEMTSWLDRYVKNAPPRSGAGVESTPSRQTDNGK
jgi:dipeptidyl aminopeptidase/acylaminoacyl peptidase